jgi:hypothetical protein
MTDRDLHEQTSTFRGNGARWVALGAVGVLVGLGIFALGFLLAFFLKVIGAVIAIIFALALIVGVCLLLTAAVTGWASHRRPFA